MIDSKDNVMWLGYSFAFDELKALERRGAAIPQADLEKFMAAKPPIRAGIYGDDEEDLPELPRLYSRQGNTGVIRIKGPMTNSDGAWTEFFDVTTYPAIREAAAFAASDPEVTNILLDIDSGGGSVSGVEGTVSMLRDLGKLKPMHAFTDGLMASAAYWIGSTAKKITTTKTAVVGSIGVVMLHMDYSKALQEQGINATVMRAGKYKALGHAAEPFTEEAQKKIQAQLDAVYAIFLEDVAVNRGVSVDKVLAMAEGQEFLGADAVAVGLATNLGSYESALSALPAGKKVDKSVGFNKHQAQITRGHPEMARATLTEAQLLAAAASGADISALNAAADAAVDAANEHSVSAAADETSKSEDAVAAAASVSGDAANSAAATDPDLVAAKALANVLQGQLTSAMSDLVSVKAELKALQDGMAAQAEATKALCSIAADSINKMNIALGGSASEALASLDATTLVARHAEVAADFSTQFQVGGVGAGTSNTVEKKAVVTSISNVKAARLKAVKTNGEKQ